MKACGRSSRKVDPKTHKRGHGRIELGPDVHIHVADLFVTGLPNAPSPKAVLQLLRRLQEGCNSFLHVRANLHSKRFRSTDFV